MPRRKPYTQLGISRVPCTRCGAPSRYQWQICALDNLWHGVCAKCDVDLNGLILSFFRVPDWQGKAADYKERVYSQLCTRGLQRPTMAAGAKPNLSP